MQQQTVEALCVQVRIGQSSLVSLPSEFVPKRINWTKWADGIAMSQRVRKNRSMVAPRLCMSPDHQDPKDNLAFMSTQNQSALEQVDLFKLISSVSDETKILFVGSWAQTLPSWFKSLQAVFAAKYASVVQEILSQQVKYWSSVGERLESLESFLVVDDVGRLSALAGAAKIWRSRQSRANVLSEARSSSWFAATLELHMPRASEGSPIRLHRLHVFKPDQWCGSPHFGSTPIPGLPEFTGMQEIWISAPGSGMSLWIADQYGMLNEGILKLRMPSALLGWHPLRDLIAFIGGAPSNSMMFMVDGELNLQVLMKESDGNV